MLEVFITIVHVVVSIALILIILLQTGKGADIGAVFGGGSSQTVFGSSGAATFLSKVTIGAAVVFMITSIFLTYFAGRPGTITEKSVISGETTSGPMEVPVPPAQMPGTGPAVPAIPQSSVPAPSGTDAAPPSAPPAAAEKTAPAPAPAAAPAPAPAGETHTPAAGR
jgi:preprotein translocase subunit SecG